MISPDTYKSDDGGYSYEEQVLHDVVRRGIQAGLITRWTPTSTAIRLLDRAGAIPRDDRDLLIDAYPQFFQPAPRKAAEIVSPPTLEI